MNHQILTSDSSHLEIVPVDSEALNRLLRIKLIDGTAHFAFTKKDGTLREAYGTLEAERIATPAANSAAPNPAIGTYFDLEANAWRSYTIANLIAIY